MKLRNTALNAFCQPETSRQSAEQSEELKEV